MNIDIRPHPSGRLGHRIIFVDALAWGTIEMDSHGPRGTSYTFHDAHGHLIRQPSYVSPTRGQQYADVRVYSDKAEKRRARLKGREVEIRPLAVRLIETVWVLIQQGDLKAPDVLEREREAREKDWQASRERMEAEKNAAFGAKADECLMPVVRAAGNTGLRIDVDALRASIVDAMKWAQSQ